MCEVWSLSIEKKKKKKKADWLHSVLPWSRDPCYMIGGGWSAEQLEFVSYQRCHIMWHKTSSGVQKPISHTPSTVCLKGEAQRQSDSYKEYLHYSFTKMKSSI